MSPSPLLPAISSENFVPQISLAPANLQMSLKGFSYPETPDFDYLVDVLASQVENVNIGQNAKPDERALIMPEGVDKKQFSAIQREASSPIVNFRQTRFTFVTNAEVNPFALFIK